MNTCALGEVAEFINGYPFAPSDWGNSGRKIIRIQNLTDSTKPYNRTQNTVDKRNEVNKGDLLVSWSATLGIFEWQEEETAYVNQHIFKVVPNYKIADKAYLKRVIGKALDDMEKHLHGATMKHVNRGEFLSTQIPLPPLLEQRRIAAILDKADELRKKRAESLRLADEFLKSVFLEMFGDPVRNPKKWEQCTIEHIGEVSTGNTPPRNDPENYGDFLEWIKSDNINTPFHYVTKATEFISKKGVEIARIVPAGSILVTCIAGSPQCIGNIALTDRKVAFNQQINAIVPRNSINLFFLYSQLLFGKKLIQSASTKSMKGMVNKSSFSAIKVMTPPKEKQDHFGIIFKKYLNQFKALKSVEIISVELFNSLIQRAFRGDL